MDRVKIVHFVGIGGCGMSAIAKILIKKGFAVTGSDLKESANTMRLKDLGAKIFIGKHNKTNVRGADITVVSSAIPNGNPEIEASLSSGVPVARRAVMLSWIMDQFKVRIAVAGTHGKTTTTSMITSVLSRCGRDPTFLIGGEANDVDGNARLGTSPNVVAEADESDGSFLTLHPTIAVITNIEADHMEHYGTLDNVIKTFISFASLVPAEGALVVGGGDGVQEMLKNISGKNVITYGLSKECDYSADNFRFSERRSKFDAYHKGVKIGEISLAVPGRQNIENALAAIAVGGILNCDLSCMSSGLQIFTGAKRRFQIVGESNKIMVIDDYGHHPTEVARTLEAARLGYPDRRIICLFQPHRYTRTQHFYEEFGGAFAGADLVIVTDVYSAGEAPIEGISGRLIYDEIKKHGKEAEYIAKKEKIADRVLEIVKPNDVIITMGAGDINNAGREVLSRLKDYG